MTARTPRPWMCPDCLHGKHAHHPTLGCWTTVAGAPCGCRRRYPEGDRFGQGENPTYMHLTVRDEES